MSESYNETPMGAVADGTEPVSEVEIAATAAKLDETVTAIAPSVQALAETMITANRETYEHARESMDEAVSMLEVTIERAGEGAIAFNRKAIVMAQDNLNSGFDLAQSLAGAGDLKSFMELQVAFMTKRFEALGVQAQELSELAAEVATNTAAPIKAQMTHSIEAFNRNSKSPY